MKKKYQNIFFIFGLVVLAVMVSQLHFAEVWQGLQRAGYWFFAVVVLWAFLYLSIQLPGTPSSAAESDAAPQARRKRIESIESIEKLKRIKKLKRNKRIKKLERFKGTKRIEGRKRRPERTWAFGGSTRSPSQALPSTTPRQEA